MPPFSPISRTAFWARPKSAVALMSMVQDQCRGVSSMAGLITPEAALLIRMSSRPNSWRIFSKVPSWLSTSATFPFRRRALRPAFWTSAAVSSAGALLRR